MRASKINMSEFNVGEIEVTRVSGERATVKAVSHESIPGLCVTSCTVFGEFEITHCISGASICGGFERMWQACLFMAELQMKAVEYGFNWNLEKDKLIAQPGFKSSGVRSDLGDAALHNKMGQFPWEDQHPADRAEDMIDELVRQGAGNGR